MTAGSLRSGRELTFPVQNETCSPLLLQFTYLSNLIAVETQITFLSS